MPPVENVNMTTFTHVPIYSMILLVERLGVSGSGRNVSVTGGLVGAGGLLEVLGSEQVGGTSLGVLGGVAGEAGVHGREFSEHCW
jgi:hypothetical protein